MTAKTDEGVIDLRLELDVLRDAKDLLAKGWVKGQSKVLKSTGYAYCATGALAAAAGSINGFGYQDYLVRQDTLRRLTDCLPRVYKSDDGEYRGAIQRFNDDHPTTHDDVLGLFQCAIESVQADLGKKPSLLARFGTYLKKKETHK